jgi:hypothetical protein
MPLDLGKTERLDLLGEIIGVVVHGAAIGHAMSGNGAAGRPEIAWGPPNSNSIHLKGLPGASRIFRAGEIRHGGVLIEKEG